jgi:hypothetical protein
MADFNHHRHTGKSRVERYRPRLPPPPQKRRSHLPLSIAALGIARSELCYCFKHSRTINVSISGD